MKRITGTPAANENVKQCLTFPIEAANAGPLEVLVSLTDGAETGCGKLIDMAVQGLAGAMDDGLFDSMDDDDAEDLVWQWVGVLDERICDRCEFYDGHQYDQDFEPIGDAPEMDGPPPVHPNCRCQLVAVDPDEDPLPKHTKLDDFLSASKPDVRAAVFGKGAAAGYDRGDISATDLLRSSAGGHELSNDNLREIRQIWDSTE